MAVQDRGTYYGVSFQANRACSGRDFDEVEGVSYLENDGRLHRNARRTDRLVTDLSWPTCGHEYECGRESRSSNMGGGE